MTDVLEILRRVREGRERAVVEYNLIFDQVNMTPHDLVYDPFTVEVGLPSPAIREALDVAIARIRRFHRATRPAETTQFDADHGLGLSERWLALGRVGVYAPNGGYPLVSSLLMTAIPAQEAGVEDIVVAISPRGNSRTHPVWNYALKQLGCHQVLAAGGAQAMAALAYGIDGLKPVDLIAGPGNRYVTAAKQALSAEGVVGIDLLAGPSEVLIIADGSARPEFVAYDLLSQAEHAEDASAILLSWDQALLTAVETLTQNARAADPHRALGRIRFELVADPDSAVDRLNQIAPEHAGLVGTAAEALAPKVRTAGALFIGAMAGQALGDYVAGPSHVLPTGGTGRFLSGLSTRTFMRRMSVIEARGPLRSDLLDHGATLAELEGLRFHQQSLLIRKSPLG
ncbi:MAG: histidinol dehydrogenase [Firmicutes bacterium]|nr:histidinol dehydrogenase [Bacillota bacterium]